jgi:hypothetical protein
MEFIETVAHVDSWSTEKRKAVLEKFRSLYTPGVMPQEQDLLMQFSGVDKEVSLLMGYCIHYGMYRLDRHRKAIHEVFDLVGMANPSTRKLAQRILDHDLSGYDSEEIFGYTQRWVHGSASPLWQSSLNRHRAVNDHHPEHHVMADFDEPMGQISFGYADMDEEALMESVLEMLARRYQYINTKSVPIYKLFNPQEWFLINHTNHDRQLAREYCQTWKENVKSIVFTPTGAEWENTYGRKLIS